MNTTSTHSGGEGTSNTPTYPRVPTAPLFKMHFQNKATLAKRKLIPSLTRDPTSKLAAAPTPQCEAGGGGDSPTLRGCLGGVCFAPPNPPPQR